MRSGLRLPAVPTVAREKVKQGALDTALTGGGSVTFNCGGLRLRRLGIASVGSDDIFLASVGA
jgi:hypothetical protein